MMIRTAKPSTETQCEQLRCPTLRSTDFYYRIRCVLEDPFDNRTGQKKRRQQFEDTFPQKSSIHQQGGRSVGPAPTLPLYFLYYKLPSFIGLFNIIATKKQSKNCHQIVTILTLNDLKI